MIFFSVLELFDFSSKLGHELMDQPLRVLKAFEQAMVAVQEATIAQLHNETQNARLEPKPNVRISFTSLPLISDTYIC